MHFTTSAALLSAAFVGTTLAAPVESGPLEARGCAVEFPSTIISLDQKFPTRASGKTLAFRTLQNQGGNGAEDMEVQFTQIPANSWGCQLEIYIPANTPITNSGSSRVNIWAIDRDISVADTWANAPKKTYLFGTTDIKSFPDRENRIIVNSIQCKPTLNFRVDIASETEYGVVSYGQQNPPSTQPVGFRLTHNC